MSAAMTHRQRAIGLMLRIATILLAVLDTNIVSSATVPIVRDLDPAHGVDKIPSRGARSVLSRVYTARGPGGTTSTIGRLTGHSHQQAMAAFAASTNVVFRSATVVMLLAAVLATRLPARREPDRAAREQPPAPVAASA
ncbi:hypothetical protein ACIBBE_00235 [Streptomyces sp. NPDC051644]|uniref:hypothetical protein n=1 Tax=Streptomyces sp. NPDC051644 TaxID=3365666 RepID=UPI0037AEB906